MTPFQCSAYFTLHIGLEEGITLKMASFLLRQFPRSIPRSLASSKCLAKRSIIYNRSLLFKRTLATLPDEQPRLRLGSTAPNFNAKTTQGDIDFHTWLGNKWAILVNSIPDELQLFWEPC